MLSYLFRFFVLFIVFLFLSLGCQYKNSSPKVWYASKDWKLPKTPNRVRYYLDSKLSKQSVSASKDFFTLGGLKDRLVEKTAFYASQKDANLTLVVDLVEFNGGKVLLESKYKVDISWFYNEKDKKISEFNTKIFHQSNSLECRNFTIIIAPAYSEVYTDNGAKLYRHYFRFQYLYNVRRANCNKERFIFKENNPKDQNFPIGDIANVHEIELFGIELPK